MCRLCFLSFLNLILLHNLCLYSQKKNFHAIAIYIDVHMEVFKCIYRNGSLAFDILKNLWKALSLLHQITCHMIWEYRILLT